MAYYKWVELTVDKGGCWALAEVCDRKHFYAEREPYWGIFLALLQVLKSLLYMFFFMMQKQLKKALHKMNKIIVTMYIYTGHMTTEYYKSVSLCSTNHIFTRLRYKKNNKTYFLSSDDRLLSTQNIYISAHKHKEKMTATHW